FKIDSDKQVLGEIELCKYREEDDDVLFYIVSKEDEDIVQVVKLEDFGIYYEGEYLELEDERVNEYLKFMAKIFKEKYVIDFFAYRNNERNEYVCQFDEETEEFGAELFDIVEQSKKKRTQKSEETYNF
ncbi:MAG: hypothetical protein IJA72_00535, partial [Clostridia bacterium]|nr:hypothetical protein [Clostridia bacterium]